MTDRKTAVLEIEEAFSKAGYPEEFLNDYDQLECLAFHHGCETFLVSDKKTRELCVAKCHDTAFLASPDAESILSQLHHEGLPAYRRSYQSPFMFIVVRSYIEGIPLSEYSQKKDLSQEEVVSLCVKLADILIYLHSQTPPVIHRDIKPENIIVTENEDPVLIDFDLARTYKNTKETDTVFFGTKGFAPPEQYGFAQTDCRSDIYSFGVLLRFLLTDSVRENSKIRLYRPLGNIIARCTAFAPDRRYPDMHQVRRALLLANPKSQAGQAGKIAFISITAAALLTFTGIRIYERITYNPFTDGSIIPLVMPDDERQQEAAAYLREKYQTHLFDNCSAYYTVGLLKDTLIEVYGMDEDYVRVPSSLEPPQENESHFLPWSLDDAQYIDRDYLAYFVTKVYWPDIAANWSSVKGVPETYPGIIVSVEWCQNHGILTGANRPRDVSCGEAAIVFANADRVSSMLEGSKNK